VFEKVASGRPFDHVRSQGNQPNVADPTTFGVAEAEQFTKLRKYQISQFRTAFKDAAYRTRLIHNVRRGSRPRGLVEGSLQAVDGTQRPPRIRPPPALRLVAGALFGHPRPA
jgi:hypothetical protein